MAPKFGWLKKFPPPITRRTPLVQTPHFHISLPHHTPVKMSSSKTPSSSRKVVHFWGEVDDTEPFKYKELVQRNQAQDLPRFETTKVTFDPTEDLQRVSLQSPEKTKKKPRKGTPHPKKVKRSFKPQREPVVDNLTVHRLRRGKMSEMEPLVKVSFDIKLEDVLIESDSDSDSDLYHSVVAKNEQALRVSRIGK